MHASEEESPITQLDISAPLDSSEISALIKASKSNSFVSTENKVEAISTFYRKTLAEIALIADPDDQVLENETIEHNGPERQIGTNESATTTNLEYEDSHELSTNQVDNFYDFNYHDPDEPTTLKKMDDELVEDEDRTSGGNPEDHEKIAYLENRLQELETEINKYNSNQNDLADYLNLLKDICSKLPPLAEMPYSDFENKILNFLREIISERLEYEISEFPEKFMQKITKKLSELHQIGASAVITMNASNARMLENELSKFPQMTIKIDETLLAGDYCISLGSLVLEDTLRMPLIHGKGTQTNKENQ